MKENIYISLQRKIDTFSIGFNSTQSGKEIDILKQIFTIEEVKLYLHLKRELSSVADIAERACMNKKETEALLIQMTSKGQTFPKSKNGKTYYAAAPFMHGFYEHQAKNMSKELAQLFEEYLFKGFFPKGKALRTIPINIDLNSSIPVAPYDDVKKIIESKGKIGLFNCACSVKSTMLESGCKKPKEVCIGFDFYAEYAIEELGIGRWITQDEALDVLKKSEEAGLVHQTGGDNRNIEAICNCCADCCVSLKMIKSLPKPSLFAGSNYQINFNPEICTSCLKCVKRCPMNAITSENKKVLLNNDRCIGCGLCTFSCPTNALVLQQKPVESLQGPPEPENYKFMRSSLDFENDLKNV
jgi:H+/Na+-translocating ferredoxin:NAD+ oxidoreductase subunit B